MVKTDREVAAQLRRAAREAGRGRLPQGARPGPADVRREERRGIRGGNRGGTASTRDGPLLHRLPPSVILLGGWGRGGRGGRRQ